MAKARTLKLRLKAIDKMSSAIDRVQNRFPKLTRGIQRASRVTKIFNAQTKQLRASLTKIGGRLKSFGRNMIIGVTLPLLAAGVASIKFFGDFQQGLAGIEKTTGITGPALEKLGKRFDQLSTEIPVSTAELLELAQAGGQLGIKGAKNIEKFTITMAKLSRASDVAGEAGAKSIARILTVTGLGIDQIDSFASSLVDLGNNAAASEIEILGVATRVAQATSQFKIGAVNVLGISTAMKSLGITAEGGGTVIGKTFRKIESSIRKGGASFRTLQKITGLTGKVLKETFKKDATKVFSSFIQGLSRLDKKGIGVSRSLEAFGLSGERVSAVIPTLVLGVDKLTTNLARAAKSFEENIALDKEFAVQTKTLNAAMIVISNTFKSLLTLIGVELAPAVEFFGKIISKILNVFRKNAGLRKFAIILGGITAVMGPLMLGLGLFLSILPGLAVGMAAFSAASLPVILTLGAIPLAIGAVIAIITLLIVKWESITNFFNKNPFGKTAKWIFLLLNPISLVINAVRLLISVFKGFDAFKNTIRDILPKSVGNFLVGKDVSQLLPSGEGVLSPLGPKKGVLGPDKALGGAKKPEKVEPFSGVLDVNFRGAPEGTNVKARAQGPFELNLGFAGGLQ